MLVLFGVTTGSAALAAALDSFGAPPEGDPSAWTGPSIGTDMAIDFLQSLAPANEGAEEGGDAGANGAIAESDLRSGGSYDIPTGGSPSPLFGAGEFEQRMILFEEFGRHQVEGAPTATLTFPLPMTGPAPEQDPTSVAASSPDGFELDAFLAEEGFVTFPSRESNTSELNPYETLVEDFLGRDVDSPPAEGRPPGEGWAHQRWNEFYPEVYVKTAQAGSRRNNGMRDDLQRHGYAVGEFAPGGLYHTVYTSEVAGAPTVEGTTDGLTIQFHPNMPVQDHKSLWTFDGTLPPKLLVARYGEPILLRHYNALPIDPSANRGFGLHTITTHEHNGHNPAESDGFANAFYFPGQYYDYRWPMQLAGYDTVNTSATDPRAAMPCDPGETIFVNDALQSERTCDSSGNILIRGDWKETMSTHWFHDHMLDFTSQNVYKGNAAMMNYYSAIDRGNEAWDDGVNLRLPSGSDLSWGNRDYDVNIVVADKAFDSSGQLWFNIFNTDGFLGDVMTANFLYKPYLDVRARKYRFRILNGAVSRYVSLALVKEVQGVWGELGGVSGSGVSYERVGFHLIANDGNIMEHALPFDGSMDLDNDGDYDEHFGQLPVQSIAERFDIVVDFASQGIVPGDKLYLVNVLEHTGGRRPNGKIPLADILSGAYSPVRTASEWTDGDPAVGKFLEFRVAEYTGTDLSMDPADYEPGGLQMIPLPIDRDDPALNSAVHRAYDFGRSSGTDGAPWTIKTDGGAGLNADPRRVSAAPILATNPTEAGFVGEDANGYDNFGTLEIWEMKGNGGWSHPIHVHFEEGVILSRDGKAPPAWERWSRKDVFRIGPEDDASHNVEVAFRFREFAGTFVEHCHNTTHEDKAMLLRWDLEHPGQVAMMPTPIPTWDGVEYVDSHALPSFRTGNGIGPTWEIPAADGSEDADSPVEFDEELLANFEHVPLVGREPLQPDLTDIIADEEAVIALGKALFWDTQVGTDGVACASCHFNAGADMRITNQINPGNDAAFTGWPVSGLNETMEESLFPFYQFVNEDDPNSEILTSTDDRMSSQGAFGGVFLDLGETDHGPTMSGRFTGSTSRSSIPSTMAGEMCVASTEGPFYADGMAHRKVEPRNTPSVINAVFNYRNFWDGRASDIFNGMDPFGQATNDNEPTSGVLVAEKVTSGKKSQWQLKLETVALPYSSLASQALGPPLSSFEMACEGFTFDDLADHLLTKRVLANQEVSISDSVFEPAGLLRSTTKNKKGLNLKYKELIKQAFNAKYWEAGKKYVVDGYGNVVEKGSGDPQINLNLAFFFGIAIQKYEATLISDDSPFDRQALSDQEAQGLAIFQTDAMCGDCHAGPLFSNAAFSYNPLLGEPEAPLERMLVERMLMGDDKPASYDIGFYNIGVTPTAQDLGIGGFNPWGDPLSFAMKYFGSFRVADDGAFKVPSLRNVGLTAPYFHNGGTATLMDVIEFYDRGGNNRGFPADGDTSGYGDNASNLDPAIQPLGLTLEQKEALHAFLLSLTDYRVSCHEAPFDHPALPMTNGHTGDDANNDGYADDIWVELPAVGSGGLTAIGESCFENNGEIFGDNQDVFNSLVTPMTSSEAQTILDESR
jgi:cytochrome c peroxidase/FtsP/CotA-like multicopper oxidase with cupredoxin domain